MTVKTNATPAASPVAPPPAPAAPAVAAAPAAPKVKKEKKAIDPNAPVMLTKGAFKKSAFLVSRHTVKQDKANLKPTLFKRKILFVMAAALRLVSSANLLRADLTGVLSGAPATADNRKSAAQMLGFVFQHLFVIARHLKAKIPAIGRGKQDGSTFDLFMAFDRSVADLFAVISGAVDGTDLTSDATQELLRTRVEACLAAAIALSKVLAQKSAQEIVTEHDKFLRTNQPAAFAPPVPKAPATPEEAAKKAASIEKMKAAKAAKAAAAPAVPAASA